MLGDLAVPVEQPGMLRLVDDVRAKPGMQLCERADAVWTPDPCLAEPENDALKQIQAAARNEGGGHPVGPSGDAHAHPAPFFLAAVGQETRVSRKRTGHDHLRPGTGAESR